jgi:hypothetical protein
VAHESMVAFWIGAKDLVCSEGTLLNLGNEDGFWHKAWTHQMGGSA